MKEKTNKQTDIGYSRTYEDKAWNHFRARLYTIAIIQEGIIIHYSKKTRGKNMCILKNCRHLKQLLNGKSSRFQNDQPKHRG